MKKYRCDVLGIESDWTPESTMPKGWRMLPISWHGYGYTHLTLSSEVVKAIEAKLGMKPVEQTREEIFSELIHLVIEEEVKDILSNQ